MASKKNFKEVDPSIFYAPEISSTHLLPEDEAVHALRVLRLQPGTLIHITDGKGNLYTATLEGSNPKSATLENLQLVKTEERYRPFLHLAIAPTKNIDRIEWTLEKLIEVGIDKVTFVNTEHTIRTRINMDRMQRIMIAAMKQSEKLSVVELSIAENLDELIVSDQSHQKFIAYCGGEYERKELKNCFTKGKSTTFLVGPEGDFTPEEVKKASVSGYQVVSLGRERLRTETAGLYVGMLHQILND